LKLPLFKIVSHKKMGNGMWINKGDRSRIFHWSFLNGYQVKNEKIEN
jgi:hypothetical protein